MPRSERDMLIASPERWDEACFSVPAVRAMIASGLGVGVICRENQADFWKTLPGLEVLAFPSSAKPRAAAALLHEPWKAALIWESGTAAEAIKTAGVPHRMGPANKTLKKLLTQPLAFAEKPLEHRVRFYLSAVEELGVPTANPEFFAPAPMGVETDEAIMLAPDSDFGPTHEWPLERWLEIAGKLEESSRKITIATPSGGRNLGKALADQLCSEVVCLDVSDLGNSLPALAAHRFVIAADASLPHLAAHTGATCVTLFGPNDPAWKRPLGRRHAVVRHHVECAPCLLAKCPMDLRCQLELEPDRVWRAIREKLDSSMPD